MEAVTNSAEFMSQTDQDPPTNGSCSALSSYSAVYRRIEFHPARKPFNAFLNTGSDFKMETLNPSPGSNKRAFSTPPGKKPDGSDSLEHGFDPELSYSITFRKIGAGLENLGNTCFLNSVLQCLTYTEPFAAYLQNVAHQNHCHVAGFCALCAMQKHVRTARQATGRILAPKDLVSNLRRVSRNFRNCRQEDAHEYMINLLECMHKCCLPYGVPSESSDAYRRSLVHKIFGGSLRSQVKCEQCSHCSNKFDPFLDLSLDISRADSLQRALSRFTAVELLDDGAKVYQCERCKQKVKAKKQLTISKAPAVLTVHLKRFEAHRSEKIDRKVQFASAIDMKPFVSGPYEGNLKYTLYGVLVHYGRSVHSGHYACFVRTSNGMWYSLDDNRVYQVSEKTVFDQKAYMLFYVRDRQNAVPKNTVAMVKKEISEESLATNRAPAIISSGVKDQVNGLRVVNECGMAPLKPCGLGVPAGFGQKDRDAKETQKSPPSTEETKELLKRDNSSGTVKSSDLAAPTVVTPKDLSAKETLRKEVPSSQTNGEGSLVKEDAKAASAISQGKETPLPNGISTSTQLVNMPTSGAKAETSVDEKTSLNGLTEAADSPKVKNALIGNSPIEKAVLIDQSSRQHVKELDALNESTKAASDIETLSAARKARKGNTKTLKVGLKFFKLSLGLRKKKKQRKERLSTIAVNIISEELVSKKINQDHSSSKTSNEVASASASGCLHEKDNSVRSERKNVNNGNRLFGSPSGILKERTNQNGAALASDQQQQPLGSSVLSEASQDAKRKRDSSKDKQTLLQKNSLDILTRGLPETVVAKWDEEVSASKKMGSTSEGMSIGYLPDEWDEEYDRGKKKKIRVKEESYGGPNPFQLLATKRQAAAQKKLTQQMNTAKTAFRI